MSAPSSHEGVEASSRPSPDDVSNAIATLKRTGAPFRIEPDHECDGCPTIVESYERFCGECKERGTDAKVRAAFKAGQGDSGRRWYDASGTVLKAAQMTGDDHVAAAVLGIQQEVRRGY